VASPTLSGDSAFSASPWANPLLEDRRGQQTIIDALTPQPEHEGLAGHAPHGSCDRWDPLNRCLRPDSALGDDRCCVVHSIVVRADSSGASHDVVDELRERSLEFSLGFHIDERVREALGYVQEDDWHPAINAVRGGAGDGADTPR